MQLQFCYTYEYNPTLYVLMLGANYDGWQGDEGLSVSDTVKTFGVMLNNSLRFYGRVTYVLGRLRSIYAGIQPASCRLCVLLYYLCLFLEHC